MLDAKIMSAVLVSLAAIATATGGGTVEPSNLDADTVTSTGFLTDLNSNPIDSIKNALVTRPEPENEMSAELSVEGLKGEKIKMQKAKFSAENFTTASLGSKKMDSDEAITIHSLNGNLEVGTASKLKGAAGSAISSGVNVSGSLSVSEELNSNVLKVQNTERIPLEFSEVEGVVRSGSTSTEFRNGSRSFNINSFSGSITIYPSNNTLLLDGKVDKLEAGEFSFGG